MPILKHDGLDFNYRDSGAGVPFFFQHGLGGDVEQPFGLFVPPKGIRLLAFDCRGHGLTKPLGDPEKLSLTTFSDDLLAMMDHFKIDQAVVGGTSMGAAVALNFALRYPQRLRGLVLSRPAWLDGPNPNNEKIYLHIVGLIREHGAEGGLKVFRNSALYRAIQAASPDAANSLSRQFEHPRAEETMVILERIIQDAPYRDQAVLHSVAVRTLVMANKQDPIHPWDFGEKLAASIPGAELRELTPKSVSVEDHTRDLQRHVETFFKHHLMS